MRSKLISCACLLVGIAWADGQSLIGQAPPKAAAMSNPLESQGRAERAQRAGAKLFARECASCHGRNGMGGAGKAPPLRQREVYDAPPGALFWVLRNGSLHHGMPSFAHLPDAQRWQIITWLRVRP